MRSQNERNHQSAEMTGHDQDKIGVRFKCPIGMFRNVRTN